MKQLLLRLKREDEGQDIIEYVLIAAALSVIAIPLVPQVGTAINALWGGVNASVGTIPVPTP
jgi:Flp pilus assembly pilin Flp